MEKKLLSLLTVFLLTIGFQQIACAQFNDGSNVGALAFQVTGGSQGFGVDARYGVTESFSARLGGSFLPISANNVFTISGFKSTTNVSAKFNNIHLLGDYTPVETMQWLRVVGGAAYLYKAKGSVNVLPTGTYSVSNYLIDHTELGNLDIGVSWKGVAPYLGLGLFRAFPTDMFNINLDLGTYYLSTPKSTVVGTNLLAENYKLEPQINSNLKQYRFLPVIQLNFNVKIR